MYERMLDKQAAPTAAEMTDFCGEAGSLFAYLNEWLAETQATERRIVFPYGNQYGWGIAHRKKNKLICNIFAEHQAYTVMMRLSDRQYAAVYERLRKETQEYIDRRYPCGDGGWIQYRVTGREHLEDVQILLSVKCS